MGRQLYEIEVEGELSEDWSEWLEGFRIREKDGGLTLLSGVVEDSSALYGLIAKLRDLNLRLVSIRQTRPEV